MPRARWAWRQENYLETQEPGSLEYTVAAIRETLKRKEETLLALTLEALDGAALKAGHPHSKEGRGRDGCSCFSPQGQE